MKIVFCFIALMAINAFALPTDIDGNICTGLEKINQKKELFNICIPGDTKSQSTFTRKIVSRKKQVDAEGNSLGDLVTVRECHVDKTYVCEFTGYTLRWKLSTTMTWGCTTNTYNWGV